MRTSLRGPFLGRILLEVMHIDTENWYMQLICFFINQCSVIMFWDMMQLRFFLMQLECIAGLLLLALYVRTTWVFLFWNMSYINFTILNEKYKILCWVFGLVVWFPLRVRREVVSSILAPPQIMCLSSGGYTCSKRTSSIKSKHHWHSPYLLQMRFQGWPIWVPINSNEWIWWPT